MNTPQTSYKEVDTSTGHRLKVYPVPQTLIWSAKPPIPKPKLPTVTMKTKAGPQERAAKEGDPAWPVYQEKLAEYEEALNTLQEDLTLVLALQDFQWPESPIDPPEYLEVAIESGILEWPEASNKIGQRAAYVRAVVAPTSGDLAKITDAISVLGGLDEEMVARMRTKILSDAFGSVFGEESESIAGEIGTSVEGSESSSKS